MSNKRVIMYDAKAEDGIRNEATRAIPLLNEMIEEASKFGVNIDDMDQLSRLAQEGINYLKGRVIQTIELTNGKFKIKPEEAFKMLDLHDTEPIQEMINSFKTSISVIYVLSLLKMTNGTIQIDDLVVKSKAELKNRYASTKEEERAFKAHQEIEKQLNIFNVFCLWVYTTYRSI